MVCLGALPFRNVYKIQSMLIGKHFMETQSINLDMWWINVNWNSSPQVISPEKISQYLSARFLLRCACVWMRIPCRSLLWNFQHAMESTTTSFILVHIIHSYLWWWTRYYNNDIYYINIKHRFNVLFHPEEKIDQTKVAKHTRKHHKSHSCGRKWTCAHVKYMKIETR